MREIQSSFARAFLIFKNAFLYPVDEYNKGVQGYTK